MQFRTFARRARGPLVLVALLVALSTLAPATANAAAGGHGSQASDHGRTADVVVLRGTGYDRAGGSRRVRWIQRKLDRLGYAAGPVDGLFGPRTEAAVVQLQRRQGLVPDGIAGLRTQAVLRAAARQATLLHRGSGYDRPGGSRRVRAVQRRLDRLGLHAGPIDGLFGPRTEAAVLRFQRSHRLASDGVVGPRTRAALRAARTRHRPSSANPHGKQHRPAAAQPHPGRPVPALGGGGAAAPVAPVAIAAFFLALGLTAFLVSYVRTRRRVRSVVTRGPRRRTATSSTPRARRGHRQPVGATSGHARAGGQDKEEDA